MRLAIIEPEARGHQFGLHARNIFREARQRGWDVSLVTTERATEHESYRMLMQDDPSLETVLMPDRDYHSRIYPLTLLGKSWRKWGAFRDGYRALTSRYRPDVIYLINLDHIDWALSLKGSPFDGTPFLGMLMSKKLFHPEMGVRSNVDGVAARVEKWLYPSLLKLRTLRKVLVIDESMAEHAGRARYPNWEKIVYVPDIAGLSEGPGRSPARTALGIPEDRFVVLLYGALGGRKGVSEALDGIAASSTSEKVSLFLAGRADPPTRELLAGRKAQGLLQAGRLFVQDGFLDDAQEAAAFAAADCVWLGYVGFHGMSGVLVQAGAAGLPVLACEEGLIGWMTRKREVGILCDPRDSVQVSNRLNELASNPELARRLASNGRGYAAIHRPEQFASSVCDAIEGSAA